MGDGNVYLELTGEGERSQLRLKNVLLVPGMRKNLLSMAGLMDMGWFIKGKSNCLALCKGSHIIKAQEAGGLFILKGKSTNGKSECLVMTSPNAASNSAGHGTKMKTINESTKAKARSRAHIDRHSSDQPSAVSGVPAGTNKRDSPATARKNTTRVHLQDAHEALAHINKRRVKEFLTREKIAFVDDNVDCDACRQGKQNKATYHSKPGYITMQSMGQVINADVCGPMHPSLGGHRYFLTLQDGFYSVQCVY